MVKIEIDGEELHVQPGAMIIEAADKAGIAIPRFCYHKKLSIAANCRMCLVDVENVGKPLPACATPVSEGMKVQTTSGKAKAAQEAVMEFLLINHPLDCPVCDQGGQCELQDVALEYGQSYSRFTERKRVVADEDLGPLIATEMTRCIHCTRCVRFGKEIAGVQELGATGRGEHMKIGTYVEQSVSSELSGNVIDLCPVGALTSKPFRFGARSWEMMSQPGIAIHDGLGANVYYHLHHGKIARVVPRESEALNEVWLSDRDRFGYEGLYSERLMQPEMKVEGIWKAVSWQTALNAAHKALSDVVKTDSTQLGVLANQSATLEEYYLLQKLSRALGVENIDHRLHQNDFSIASKLSEHPGFNLNLPDLQGQEAILVVGSLLQQEAPLVAHRIRQASLAGSQVAILNPTRLDYAFEPNVELIQVDLVQGLAQVAAALGIDHPALSTIQVTEQSKQIAKLLSQANTGALVLGQWVETHPDRGWLYALAEMIAEKTQAHVNAMTPGSNSRGAWEADMRPSESGLTAQAMFEQPRKAYLLHNLEPEHDIANPKQAIRALEQAQAVVMTTPYITEAMRRYATVLLPSVPATETSGTFINYFGDWQTFRAATKPQGEARPAWKIFRVLGNLFEVEGFDYESSEAVLEEVRAQHVRRTHHATTTQRSEAIPALQRQAGEYIRLAPYSLYGQDNVVRRATSLQATKQQKQAQLLHLHPDVMQSLGLKAGDTVKIEQAGEQSELVEVMSNPHIPKGAVMLAQGINVTASLGSGYVSIRILTNVA